MATQIQVAVVSALEGLKLEPQAGGVPGGPVALLVTKQTAQHVQSLVGTTLEVNADGSVTPQ